MTGSMIDQLTGEHGPCYEHFGWHHWPGHLWLSYQFRRAPGETKPGGVWKMPEEDDAA